MKNFLNFINEMVFDKIETTFEQERATNKLGGFNYKYIFQTTKGNKYSVYFILTKEDDNTILNDDTILPNNILIPTIMFSGEESKLNKEVFDNLTNRHEFAEVMGKVIYLILEYISNYPEFKTYSIGEVEYKKFKFYNNYRYHFSNYDIKTGKSKNYLDNDNNYMNTYFLINKNIQQK